MGELVDRLGVLGERVDMERVPCNFCGSSRQELLFKSEDNRYKQSDHEFSVVRCCDCGLSYLSPRPTIETIQVFYPGVFFGVDDSPRNQKKYKEELSRIDASPPGKLLDIGCRDGGFVKFANEMGWSAEGVENAGNANNPFGLVIHEDFSKIPDGSQDVVTSWAVFEHLHDPLGYFNEVARVLKPDGEFVFLVPNFASYRSRHMLYEDVPRHIYFYTPDSAGAYLRKCGFSVEKIDQDSRIYDGGHRKLMLYLALKLIGRKFDLKYQKNLKKNYKEGALSLWELLYLYPFERLDRLVYKPVSWLFARMGKNGTMVVHARKL